MFSFAEKLAARGFVCLTFDMRGHGATGGELEQLSRQDFLTDVTAAYDFLAAQPGVDASRITVIGSSFGGYMTALLSAERPVHAVVLRVPADYRDEQFDIPLVEAKQRQGGFEWKTMPHDKTETAALRAIHVFKGRILIVESEKDEVVPGALVKSYGNAASFPERLTYAVMIGAPHTTHKFPKFVAQYENIVCAWLSRDTYESPR